MTVPIRLLDQVTLLRALAEDMDDAFCRRVQEAFRQAFQEIFEQDKLTYVQEVIENQCLSYAELAELLGVSGASAITNWKKTGAIRFDKFELMRATVGRQVRWPSPEDRTARVMVQVVTHVQQVELQRPIDPPLSLEGYYTLKFALGNDQTLADLRHEQEEQAWVTALLEKVHKHSSANDIRSGADIRAVIDRWSPAFVRTQIALLSLVR